jgi:hypothetical protein
MDRTRAVDHLEWIVDVVAADDTPVPVREVWALGDVALGLDPIDRLDVYVTKEVRLGTEPDPDLEREFGLEGVGATIRGEWAREHPDCVRGKNGYAAPEACLAAQLLPEDEPAHLEVCNAPFEENVTRRLEGARASGDYEQALDPRAAALWAEGQRSDTALAKLRSGELAFPPLSTAFEALGLDDEEAATAASAVHAWRADAEGASVRGDVV